VVDARFPSLTPKNVAPSHGAPLWWERRHKRNIRQAIPFLAANAASEFRESSLGVVKTVAVRILSTFEMTLATLSGTSSFEIHPRCVLPWYYKMFGESQTFCGNTDDFPCNCWCQSKMELWYQKKEFIARRMSGTEQLGSNS